MSDSYSVRRTWLLFFLVLANFEMARMLLPKNLLGEEFKELELALEFPEYNNCQLSPHLSPMQDPIPQNTGKACVIVADVLGKLDSSFTFKKDSVIEATDDLLQCMQEKGAYRPGVGTDITWRGLLALCQCQEAMVNERMYCRYNYGRAFGPFTCQMISSVLEDGGMAIFGVRNPNRGIAHALKISSITCNKDGSSTIEYQDPDTNKAGKLTVSSNGAITTGQYAGNVTEGYYAAAPFYTEGN